MEHTPAAFAGSGAFIGSWATMSGQLFRSMAPAIYGIASGHLGAPKSELNDLGCFRVSTEGTRVVFMFSAVHISEFLSDDAIDPCRFLSTASPENIQSFHKRFPIFCATCGPTDTLYTPPGFISLHKVMHGRDCFGVRVGAFVVPNLPTMEKLVQMRVAARLPRNEAMDEAVTMAKEHMAKNAELPQEAESKPQEPKENAEAKPDEPKEKAEAKPEEPKENGQNFVSTMQETNIFVNPGLSFIGS